MTQLSIPCTPWLNCFAQKTLLPREEMAKTLSREWRLTFFVLPGCRPEWQTVQEIMGVTNLIDIRPPSVHTCQPVIDCMWSEIRDWRVFCPPSDVYAQILVLPIVCHKWGSVFVYLLVPVGTSIPELNRHLLTRHLGAAATDQYHRCYSESMQCWSFFASFADHFTH